MTVTCERSAASVMGGCTVMERALAATSVQGGTKGLVRSRVKTTCRVKLNVPAMAGTPVRDHCLAPAGEATNMPGGSAPPSMLLVAVPVPWQVPPVVVMLWRYEM